MPMPSPPESLLREALAAYESCGRNFAALARQYGKPRSTVQSWINSARARGLQAPEAPIAPAPAPPAPQFPDLYQKPVIRVPARPASPNETTLIISDIHAPYQHPDLLRFYQALKAKYGFQRIVGVGDELDNHAMSFHDSDPDLDSAGRELQSGRHVLWELEALFPRIDFVSSNHGDMLYRRAKTHGIPRHLVLEYGDAIFAEKDEGGRLFRRNGRGEGWRWHHTLLLDLPTGQKCLVHHGMSISTKRNVEQSGMCFIQGHHHGTFEIVYVGTPDSLNWGMTVGCGIDDHALAFAYNKNTLRRPIIGCGAILDGQPKLLPMVLAKGGRWTGFVP